MIILAKDKEEEKKEVVVDDSRIKELERKLAEQGDTIKQQQETIQQAEAMANIIAYNPQLKDHFVKVRDGAYGISQQGSGEQQEQESAEKKEATAPASKTPVVDPAVQDLKASQREMILRDFEARYGISNLKDEERKEARRKIENFMNEWGTSVQTAPLATLNKQLESAYVSTHAEKLKEEGKLEGFATAMTNAQASMPSMGGSRTDVEEQEALSQGQLTWAKKLGVDPQKAAETYRKRDEEQTTDPVAVRSEK